MPGGRGLRGGGSYAATRGGTSVQAFMVTEADGTWSGAHPVPGLAPADAAVTLMSCAAPLACTAAGYDDNGRGIFVVSTAPTMGPGHGASAST